MNSSRLPGKHCYKVYGQNIIEYLIKRLKKVKHANDIILATTNTKKDDILFNISKKIKLNVLEEVNKMLCKEFYLQLKKIKQIL